MESKRVLILSAGKGTRMGAVGELLPKPLWPIFNSTLLEIQIKLWQSRGFDQIYVNTYHQAQLIKDYLAQKYPEVILLEEDYLLGVGGAVHNLCRHESIAYKGNLLVTTSDAFLFSSQSFWKDNLTLLQDTKNVGVLNLIEVPKGSAYTNVHLNSDLEVTHFSKDNAESFYTYSGQSLINLEKLAEVEGESNFFESVCNFKSQKVLGHMVNRAEYWDFGTLQQYYSALYKLMSDDSSQLAQFLTFNAFFEKVLIV